MNAATTDAFLDYIWPTLLRSPIIMGILPKISITAKSTMLAVAICLSSKLNVIPENFLKTRVNNYS